MSTCVNRTPHDYILRILSDVAPVKFLKMRWSIWASTWRNSAASPLQVLLILDHLISPSPISSNISACYITATPYGPTMTMMRHLLVSMLCCLPLPPPVIITSGGHLGSHGLRRKEMNRLHPQARATADDDIEE